MDYSPPSSATATARASRTAGNSPSSSPGLFSPSSTAARHQQAPSLSDGTPHPSPFLHPLQMHKVRETHKAQVEQDFITGRKLINQYEIIDEIGRGVHGKVKLARSLETLDYVAIKIIQRFSKKRRLGRVTVSPQDKTKREIAILKKIRHPNIVGLLEVIDDPELKKIYMVLEHVELGEIVWRKKGTPQICLYERRRIEREIRGEKDTGDDEKIFKMMERRRQRKEAQRAKVSQLHLANGPGDFWSLEHGDDDDEADMLSLSRKSTRDSSYHTSRSQRSLVRSTPGSRVPSRAASRAPSRTSTHSHTPLPTEFDIRPLDSDNEDEIGPLPLIPSAHGSATALEGTYYGPYSDDPPFRGRSPSMADSVASHMSSLDDMIPHDCFEDDFSYVPCFTIDQARSTFRDTVLGLEYLHYEGIVHRDIKPANLLWTKDHRVKISDFGVSYFGRPIRDGEPEENISETDATDFDDDLELAKTVGTPAFFAPELCYTDLDIEQPKVTEQIDVWSLGITLYCLIYARIPFMAEDEYKLFRAIAKEDVYIPRQRLKALDPACSSSQTNLNKRIGPPTGLTREEGELAYEEIDDELYDLLRRMLIKDPVERMKLREVKRHPWAIRGVENIIGWLDDSDPSRKSAGRRIQVDDRELERAVVPITFLERARSAVKKAVGKVIGATRSERAEGSRRRAVSSATSSGNDQQCNSPASSATFDNYRRASLRGDESLFTSVGNHHEHRDATGHPLAQSLTASPELPNDNGDPFALDFAQETVLVGAAPRRVRSGTEISFIPRSGPRNRTVSTAASIQTIIPRGHSQSRSMTHTPTRETAQEDGPRTPGPVTDHIGGMFGGLLWNGRGRDAMVGIEEGVTSRARSVDRGLFGSEDKHSGPSVATSAAVAPGRFEQPTILRHPRPLRSAQTSPSNAPFYESMASPLFANPYLVHAHQTAQSASTPNVASSGHRHKVRERPATASRTPEVRAAAARLWNPTTPESVGLADEPPDRQTKLETEAQDKLHEQASAAPQHVGNPPAHHSLDEDMFPQEQQSKRAGSSSSVNSVSHVTSPSDLTSPISSVNLGSQEQFFPSVPSLPALISGASSVSADPEGDFLQRPGVVRPPEAVLTAGNTPDTLTPPMLSKQPSAEGDETTTGSIDLDSFPVGTDPDEEGYNGDGDTACPREGDDSDSDEGLTMGKKKPLAKRAGSMARRGTNASVGSTETAKKVSMDG